MVSENVFTAIPRKESVVNDVVQQVTDAIVNGYLEPGDQLVEERMAEQFGVSRAPIREALYQLQVLGLVERRPYRGSFVSSVEEREIVELQKLRVVLEEMAVRLCTENLTEEMLAVLEEIVDNMARVAEKGDRRQILVYDADFHDALVHYSGNQLLADVWELVSVKMRRFLYLKRYHTHDRIEDVVSAHAAILEAIESGDPDQASAALQSHLSHVEERVRSQIGKTSD
jgi:DNA-binding GntR family transcriptional regulator